MICGPTTVGIDGSGSLEDVCNIVYDAFDYYGVAVARSGELSSASSSVVGDKRLSTGSTASESGALTTSHLANAHLSEDAFPSGGNRRISVGVYGMFTK